MTRVTYANPNSHREPCDFSPDSASKSVIRAAARLSIWVHSFVLLKKIFKWKLLTSISYYALCNLEVSSKRPWELWRRRWIMGTMKTLSLLPSVGTKRARSFKKKTQTQLRRTFLRILFCVYLYLSFHRNILVTCRMICSCAFYISKLRDVVGGFTQKFSVNSHSFWPTQTASSSHPPSKLWGKHVDPIGWGLLETNQS